MNWSRRRGHPPGLRRLPKDDQPPRSMPLLTQPFEAGLTGWIVVFGGVIAELAGGAAVSNQTSTATAVLVLILPVVVVFGFAVAQWWQVRSSAAEPASWWHLAGIAAGVLIWLLWPTVPGPLAGTTAVAGASSGRVFCYVLPPSEAYDCLHRAGLRQPQRCLVVNGCLDTHRGAARAQVADRGMGGDSCRARWLPARYLLPQPDCPVLPPRISLASWPLIGHAVGTAFWPVFRIRNMRGMIPAVRETSDRIRAGSSTNSLAGRGGLRSREHAPLHAREDGRSQADRIKTALRAASAGRAGRYRLRGARFRPGLSSPIGKRSQAAQARRSRTGGRCRHLAACSGVPPARR